MASVVEAKGTDAFWQAPIEELLPESLKGEALKLEKRLETMDVWFDSGTSWAGCVEGTEGLSFPADLYLEVRIVPAKMVGAVPRRNAKLLISPLKPHDSWTLRTDSHSC